MSRIALFCLFLATGVVGVVGLCGCRSGLEFSASITAPAIGTGPAAVWADDAGNVYVVGQDPTGTMGMVVRSQDSGGSWGQVTVSGTTGFTGVWGASANSVWVVGPNYILVATDGQHFTRVANSTGKSWLGVTGLPNGVPWFVEPGGVWTVQPPGDTLVLAQPIADGAHGIWVPDTAGPWAVSDGGNIYAPGVAPAQVGGQLLAIGGSSAHDAFAGGAGGRLVHLSGNVWTPIAGVLDDVRSIWAAPTGAAYLVGPGGVYSTSNGGASFVHSPTPAGTSIWGTPGGQLWVVGNGQVYLGMR